MLPVAVLLDLGAQALDGLHCAHEQGIVHRDVKPENLMVADVAGRPTVKIIDLGVARRADQEGLTTTGIFVGKLRYASPEQLGALKRGEEIDGRSDVYSLGCVLYHLLTGSPAYLAETPQAWIRQHVLERPRPFATTDRTFRVPEPVRHAVLKALAKDRSTRFASAADFAAVLRALAKDLAREAGEDATRKDLDDARALLSLSLRAGSEKSGPATVEDLVAIGLLALPREGREPEARGSAVEEATVRLSQAASAAGRAGEKTRSRRLHAGVALGASVLVLAGALAAWLSTRSAGPGPLQRPLAPGALVLNASPWGRVVSVVEEPSGASFDAGGAVTPCRLELPAGRWRVVVRGADGAEAAATVVVREGRQS
ncbi:serine/threonine protein kinase, partial [bacterium]|nr:serine/threonine protein kinase [bacterium]